MEGEADQSLFTTRLDSGEIADPKRAIFPILKIQDGQTHFIGTGFFVTTLGFFITARHVLEDIIGCDGVPTGSIRIIQFHDGMKFCPRPVIRFCAHEHADVAVGVCAEMTHKVTGEPLYNKVLPISLDRAQLEEHVYTYAYPGTIVESQEAAVDVALRCKFYAGKVQEYYPSGRDRIFLPYPCYRTSITLHGGASGGPVLGESGKVIGVNSTGFDGATDISFISRIEDCLDLTIHNVVLPEHEDITTTSLRHLISINHVAV